MALRLQPFVIRVNDYLILALHWFLCLGKRKKEKTHQRKAW